jgi:hypothetical protein
MLVKVNEEDINATRDSAYLRSNVAFLIAVITNLKVRGMSLHDLNAIIEDIKV